MNIDELTIKQARELANLFGNKTESSRAHPFQVGNAYLVRTVTMIILGKLEVVFDNELLLSQASWIADTGRFSEALSGGEDKLKEIEPFPNDVIIGRNSIIDATVWEHKLPTEQK